MHRALVVASFSILALAPTGRAALAQAAAVDDSSAHATVDRGPVVDTASRKSSITQRDRILAGCVGRSLSPVAYLLPLFCARQSSALVGRALFDSVTFVRNGREYSIAVRNAVGIPLLNRQKRTHAVTGAVIGGGLGFAVAAVASLRTGSNFGSSALILGGTGVVIGAFSGSKYLTEWPRVLQETATPSR